jgi:hypothetical protein
MQKCIDGAENPWMRTTGDHVLDRVHQESKRPRWVVAIHLELQRKISLTLLVSWKERPWQEGHITYVIIVDNFVTVVKYEFGVKKRKEQSAQRGSDRKYQKTSRQSWH